MGVATDIFNGVRDVLLASGLGITFNDAGTYAANETGILAKTMPATPDRVVVISVVPLEDELAVPSGRVMVQLRYRGVPNRPLDVDDLGDSVKPFLHGLTNVTFGTVKVQQMVRQLSVPMGQDELKRWERADQFYLDVEYPGSTLVPETGTY